VGAGWYSYACGVNNTDLVVGTSNGSTLVWYGGPLTNLNTRLPASSEWRLDAARAINDDGPIVGFGFRGGRPRCRRQAKPVGNGVGGGQTAPD
jgi:hypothetical protein